MLIGSNLAGDFFTIDEQGFNIYDLENITEDILPFWIQYWRKHNPQMCSESFLVIPLTRGILWLDIQNHVLKYWFCADVFTVLGILGSTPILVVNGTFVQLTLEQK